MPHITQEQNNKIDMLLLEGYRFDNALTIPHNGIVLVKGEEIWVFTLEGDIIQNPVLNNHHAELVY